MDFAWAFWTDVRNWALDADVEMVTLNGPFERGTAGVTMSKSSGRIEWKLAEVQHGRAVVDFPAPGAIGRFVWTFQDQDGMVRITQRASLCGEQAAMYADSFGRALEKEFRQA